MDGGRSSFAVLGFWFQSKLAKLVPVLFVTLPIVKLFLHLFDLFKDLALITVFLHVSEVYKMVFKMYTELATMRSQEILNHNYSTIGDIDLDHLTIYLMAIVASSQVAVFAYGILEREKTSVFFAGAKWPRLTRGLFLLFPIHFSLMDKYSHAYKIASVKRRIERDLSRIGRGESDVVKSYLKHLSRLTDLDKAMFQIVAVNNRLQLIESALDRFPQAIVQLSLFVASTYFGKLKTLFKYITLSKLGIGIREAFFIGVTTSCWGIVNAVKNFREEMRSPTSSSTVVGSVLKRMAIWILLAS